MNKEDLIKMLQNCEDANCITRDKFCTRFGINSSEFYGLTDGMRKLRKDAGIHFNWKNKKINDDDLIVELKALFEETKMPVTERIFDEKSKYSSSDLTNHFGSWKSACELANVPFVGAIGMTQRFNTNCLVQVLKAIGIEKVETEKRFDGCVNPQTGKKLPYDYYVEELNLLIEVDGFTHYDKDRYERIFNRDFSIRVKLDKIKDNFAKENHIKLLRIKQSNFNLVELAKIFNLEKEFVFEFNVNTKQEELAEFLTKSIMQDLYINKKMSDNDIANKYNVDYNLVYRLRKNVYGIVSRSCKEQKTKMNIIKLIECYFNDVPYRLMSEICGAQNCYRVLQRILKENPSIADVKSLKKSGKAGDGQSDLKVEIYDRPPYVSFVGEIPNRGNA